MEDRETARMRKYGESKTTRIMMATVPHVTTGLGLRKFQADGYLLTRVYSRMRTDRRADAHEANGRLSQLIYKRTYKKKDQLTERNLRNHGCT